MTDRDHFAAAALTGLLASGMDSVDEMPTRAYRMADAMLRERERPGRDDSVSQNTAETMRSFTEPTPKEKRAEVPVSLTDAEREAVEDAIRRLWGFDIAATLRGLLERLK